MSIFDQTGQKVGIQINDDSEELVLHRLVDKRSGNVIRERYLTVDKAYMENKHYLGEALPYRWEVVE